MKSFLVLATCLIVGAGSVQAGEIKLGSLVFSDEDSTIVLHEGWGTGTQEDPYTLVEDITGDERAILTIRGLRRGYGNRINLAQPIGFAIKKIVRNMTGKPWHVFEMELREIKDRNSTYEDGLSFAQASGQSRLYYSDRFSQAWQTDEPLDAITFSGAVIMPGETVTIHAVITDFSPNYQIYLVQRRQAPVSDLKPSPTKLSQVDQRKFRNRANTY